MKIEYADTKIKKLCSNPTKFGRSDYSKKILTELEDALIIISNMQNCKEFYLPIHRCYKFERLVNKGGLMSIRLDKKFRLTFIDIENDEKKEFINITGIIIKEVSNHYGD